MLVDDKCPYFIFEKVKAQRVVCVRVHACMLEGYSFTQAVREVIPERMATNDMEEARGELSHLFGEYFRWREHNHMNSSEVFIFFPTLVISFLLQNQAEREYEA